MSDGLLAATLFPGASTAPPLTCTPAAVPLFFLNGRWFPAHLNMMAAARNEHGHPFASLDRRQSRRIPSIPIGDSLQSVMARKTEAPPYDDLILSSRKRQGRHSLRNVRAAARHGLRHSAPEQRRLQGMARCFSVPAMFPSPPSRLSN